MPVADDLDHPVGGPILLELLDDVSQIVFWGRLEDCRQKDCRQHNLSIVPGLFGGVTSEDHEECHLGCCPPRGNPAYCLWIRYEFCPEPGSFAV